MDSLPLRVGLVAETVEQLNAQRRLIQSQEYVLVKALLADEVSVDRAPLLSAELDVWLVTVSQEHPAFAGLEGWLSSSSTRLIFDDGEQSRVGHPEFSGWCRRVVEKLKRLPGQMNLERAESDVAPRVWVLAASTGGPAAVKRFLSALPQGLAVGFLYVQHINPGHELPLVEMISKCSHYGAYQIGHGDIIRNGKTAVIASPEWVDCLPNGTLSVRHEPWPGPYSPSVDQVLGSLARAFGAKAGTIVFSGMGNDGAKGARLLHQRGGQVWVQTPSTCTVAAMPEAVMATGVVNRMGSPEILAGQLADYLTAQSTQLTR